MNQYIKSIFLVIVLFISLNACDGKKSDSQKEKFKLSEIIANVNCNASNDLSYSLYLPKQYKNNKKLPLLFVFDAKARGQLSIKLFKEAAEEFGYILVGSNSSKNGMTQEMHQNVYQSIYDDCKDKLNFDTNRVYTAGFSGGGRVAAFLANSTTNILGYAGFSASDANFQGHKNSSFILFAGTSDFNYLEIKSTDKKYNDSNIPHQLIYFDGKHDWSPNSQNYRDALLWFEVNAMRSKIVPKNSLFINNLLNKFKSKLDSINNEIIKTHEFLKNVDKSHFDFHLYNDKYMILTQLINYFEGNIDVSQYKSERNNLLNDKNFIQLLNNEIKFDQLEIQFKNNITKMLQENDLKWWNRKLNEIEQGFKLSKTEYEKLYNKRLFAYLSLVSYMFSQQTLDNGLIDKAKIGLEIYKRVDPENSDYPYLSARLNAYLGNDSNAIEDLTKAVAMGLDTKDKLKDEKLFQKYTNNPKYRLLFDKIEENRNK